MSYYLKKKYPCACCGLKFYWAGNLDWYGDRAYCFPCLKEIYDVLKRYGKRFSTFRIKTVEGAYEPWYCGVVNTFTNQVLEKWWECPHCGMEFKARDGCEKHCKGKIGSFPPTCSALYAKP